MKKTVFMVWVALVAALTMTMSACSDDDDTISSEQQAEILLKNRLKTNYWVSVENDACELMRFTDDKCYYENVSVSSYENLRGTYSVKGSVVTISFEDTNGPFEITCSLDGRELVATSKYGTTLFLHDTLNESKIFELEGNGYGLTKHYDYVSGRADNTYVIPGSMNPVNQPQEVTVEQFKENLGFNLNTLLENISFEEDKMVLIYNMLGEMLRSEFAYKVVQEDGIGFWEGKKRSRLELQMPIGGSTKTVCGRMLKSKGQLLISFDNVNSRDFYSALWLSFAEQGMGKKFPEADVTTFKNSFDAAFDYLALTFVLGENSRIADAKLRYELAQYSWSYLDKEENSFMLLHFGANDMAAVWMTGDGMATYTGPYGLSDSHLTARLIDLQTGRQILLVGKVNVEGDNLRISGFDGEKVLERTKLSVIDDFEKYRYTLGHFHSSIKLGNDKVVIEEHPQLVIGDNPIIDVRKLADDFLDGLETLSYETWFEDGRMKFAVEFEGESMEFSMSYEVSESELGSKLLTITGDTFGISYGRTYGIAAYKDDLILTYMTDDIADIMADNYLGDLFVETGYKASKDDRAYIRSLVGGAISSSMVSFVLKRNK